MSRHIFAAISEYRYPVVGDLVRSENSGDYINLVIRVDPPKKTTRLAIGRVMELEFCLVHSVRYANTNGGNCLRLYGSRVRPFEFFRRTMTNEVKFGPQWDIVKEYGVYDNSEDIAKHMKSLEGKQLYWQPELEEE